jgi:hypothetical protein
MDDRYAIEIIRALKQIERKLTLLVSDTKKEAELKIIEPEKEKNDAKTVVDIKRKIKGKKKNAPAKTTKGKK